MRFGLQLTIDLFVIGFSEGEAELVGVDGMNNAKYNNENKA